MNKYFDKYKLLSDSDPDIVVGINKVLQNIFKEKIIDIDFIKYILISPDLKNDRLIYKNESIEYKRLSLEEMILNTASEKDCLNLVKFLFTNFDVDKEYLYRSLDSALYGASTNGSLKTVKYLSTSSDLKQTANIDHFHSPLVTACQNGHLNIVKFFFESSKLKNKNLIEQVEDYFVFSHLCNLSSTNLFFNNDDDDDDSDEKKSLVEKKLLVLQYLIVEQKLKKDADIANFIEKPENKAIKSMFEVQELQTELNSELNEHITKRKPKL